MSNGLDMLRDYIEHDALCMRRRKCCEIEDVLMKEMDALKVENTKLREERDEFKALSELKDTQFNNVLSSVEMIKAENAKLRELAGEAVYLIYCESPDCGLCKHYSECWGSEAMNYSPGGCIICNEAKELGIGFGR